MSQPTKVLISGLTGGLGRALAAYIYSLDSSIEIHGLVRDHSMKTMDLLGLPMAYLHLTDLTDVKTVGDIVHNVEPDLLFHLGAQSVVPLSYTNPEYTMQVNIQGSIALLEAVRYLDHPCRMAFSSSSEIYGQVVQDDLPIRETQPIRPASPYAASKAVIDQLIAYYYCPIGLDVVRSRCFTMTGAFRGATFAEGSFASQIASCEAFDLDIPIQVGNLDSTRTVMDYRDAARAVWMMMERCPSGEVYNIGGVATLTIREMLEYLLSLSNRKLEYQVDQELLRPTDVTLQVPDCSKFRAATGWMPEINWQKTLADLLDYYRNRFGVTA